MHNEAHSFPLVLPRFAFFSLKASLQTRLAVMCAKTSFRPLSCPFPPHALQRHGSLERVSGEVSGSQARRGRLRSVHRSRRSRTVGGPPVCVL